MKIPTIKLLTHYYSGQLITIDGVDGTGKSTAVTVIHDYLYRKKIPYVQVFTPGIAIRQLDIFRQSVDAVNQRERSKIDTSSLLLLVLSDMRQLVYEQIIPALIKGKVVICERYLLTTLAEGLAKDSIFWGSQEGMTLLTLIEQLFIAPNLQIMMHINEDGALQRIKKRPQEKYRAIDIHFFYRRIHCYYQMAQHNKIPIIDTSHVLINNQKNIIELLNTLFIE